MILVGVLLVSRVNSRSHWQHEHEHVLEGRNQNIASNLNLEYGLDWYQMLMIHDEVQLACKPEHTKAIQKESLDAFPQAQEFFGFKCKIEGDSKVGSNWAETH